MAYDAEGNYIPDGSVEVYSVPDIPASSLPSISTPTSSGDIYSGMTAADIEQYNQEQAEINKITTEQAPAIQAVQAALPSFKSELPADLTSQIQNLSESLLQQQTQIQDVVTNAVQQQQAVNSAAQQYQSAAQTVNNSTSAYNADYNAWLNAQSGIKRNGQPMTIGQMMAVAKQFGRSPADAWGASWSIATKNTQGLIDKYNQDLNNINTAKQQLADSQNAYNASLSSYQGSTQQLQNLVNDYNNNYTQYQSAVGTAKSDLAAKAASKTTSGGSAGGKGNATVGTAGGSGGASGAGNATIGTTGKAGGTTTKDTAGNVSVSSSTTNAPSANVATSNTTIDKTTFEPLKPTDPKSFGLTPKGSSPTSKAPSSTGFAPSTPSSSTPLSSALLGSGLSSRPDVSTTSDPYLLGTDEAKKNVWNTDSLKNALGI